VAGRIAVVDAQDRFVRWEGRKLVHDERLVHRSIHVLLLDSQGRLVVQRRHRQKQTYPGHWDLSASGHVEESDYPSGPDDDLDRVYREVAARELEEELGVRAPLTELGHFGPEPGVHYEQLRLFTGRHDGPYVAQPEEVSAVAAVTRAGWAALAASEPVTHTMAFFSARLADRVGWR
jgi:isopentenyldiphosphate isomerase